MIRAAIIEDHPLMRSAILATLESDPEIIVTGAGGSKAELFGLLETSPCDVVMLDLYLPKFGGLDIICALRKDHPKVNILVFSSSTDANDIYRSLQSGALGYLTKDANSAEVLRAIHTVSQGKAYLPVAITDVLINAFHQRGMHNDIYIAGTLTRREYQIMTLLGEGYSNTQLSEQMNISKETVRTHIYNIKKKLAIENRSQLILLAAKQKSLGDR